MTAFQRLNLVPELFYDDQWNPVTDDARGGKTEGFGVDISAGRPDEATRLNPTSVELTLNNRGPDFPYSPRRPTSPLYGKIRRNTPLRVSVGDPFVGQGFSATPSANMVAPSLDTPTGGLLVGAWLTWSTPTAPGSMTLGAHTLEPAFNQNEMLSAYEVVGPGATGTRTATQVPSADYAGGVVLLNGAGATVEQVVSTAVDGGDATLTTAPGTQAGWWLVAVVGWIFGGDFATRQMPNAPEDDEGGWIPLADSGYHERGGIDDFLITRIAVRPVKFDGEQTVTFYGMDVSTTLLALHAHLYVVSGLDFWSPRATVEVSEWPQRANRTGSSVWVPVTGNGVSRRLGQGDRPLESPIRRAVTGTIVNPINLGQVGPGGISRIPLAYWPLEDGEEATQGENIILGGNPMRLSEAGAVVFADVDGPPGSKRLPNMLVSTGSARMFATVATIASAEPWLLSFIIKYDATGFIALDLGVASSGPFDRLFLTFGTNITLTGSLNGSTTLIGTIGVDLSDDQWYWFNLIGNRLLVGDVRYTATAYDLAGNQVVNVIVGTIAGPANPGPIKSVTVRNQTSGNSASVGHVAYWSSLSAVGSDLARQAFNGHIGETAGRRLERLCAEELIPFFPVGDLDETVPMGAQSVSALLDLINECVEVDQGFLSEPRGAFGFSYKTLQSSFNQQGLLQLSYDSCHLAPEFSPTEDDRYTINEATVTRSSADETGSSEIVTQETGPLGTETIGVYDTSVSVNVMSDLMLEDQASWRVHLGTVDEPRFPNLHLRNLAFPNCPLDPDLAAQASVLDLGDVLTIDDPPPWLAPDQIRLMFLWRREHLDWYEFDFILTASPEEPFHIAELEHSIYSIIGSDSATLDDTGGLTPTEAFVTINCGGGGDWVHEVDFDIMIGGERMTVTAVGAPAGTYPNRLVQLTVVRSVNGVVKSHDNGVPVEMFHKIYIGL